MSQLFASIVTSAVWIRGGQNTRPRVQRRLNACFSNTDGLLLHRLVNGDLVFHVHLIKFIDAANTVIGEHERAGFDTIFTSFDIFSDSCRQTSRRRALA